jgi:2-methylisocitrate lyase-like PEP mutase family enzyme
VLTLNGQIDHAETFHRLHVKGNPIVLFNVWDAGSASVVAAAGAKAIATASWAVAAARGFEDGEMLPLADALDNLTRIIANVELPVTIDLESGYGETPEIVAETVTRAISVGAIGFNLEDQIIGGDGLYSIEAQSRRLKAARHAAKRASIPEFINARTDLFIKAATVDHDSELVNDALQRARAYADAGASGIFVPGLTDKSLIGRMCNASPIPVNVMVLSDAPPTKRLAELGVARISCGPAHYLQMMRLLERAARAAFSA